MSFTTVAQKRFVLDTRAETGIQKNPAQHCSPNSMYMFQMK